MVANNPKMNGVKMRKGGRGQSRNLRSNQKVQNSSSNSNWRDLGTKANTNTPSEANNYGYKNPYLTDVFLLMVGLPVQIEKTDGHVYEGILETVSNNLDFHLCNVGQKVNNKENDISGSQTEKKLIFHFRDISYCKATDVDMEFGKKDTLLTDAAIAASNASTQQRELVQWKDDNLQRSGVTGLLEDDPCLNGSWNVDDMYRENEEKHGVRSTFDSSLNSYMTPIERRDDEAFKEQEQRAERIAREMQNCNEYETIDSSIGEEELFSAVSRVSNVSNDGFTTNTRHSKNTRNGKSSNIVGPRFQNKNFTKHQELNQVSNFSNPINHHQSTNNRTQQTLSGEGLIRNNNSVNPNQASSQAVLSSQQLTESIGPTSDFSRVSHQLDNFSIAQSGIRTMSYSAVTKVPKVSQSNKPQNQSLVQQSNVTSMSTSFNDTPILNSPPANNSPHQLTNNLNSSPEAFSTAKQKVNQNSKNYASIASNVVAQQQTVKEAKHIASSECNTNNESILPKPQEQSKFIVQERKTLLPEQKESPQLAVDPSSTNIKLSLNKYGKVHSTQNADEEHKTVDVNELKEFGRDFKLTDKPAKKVSKTRMFPTNTRETNECLHGNNAKPVVTSESSVPIITTLVTNISSTTTVKTTANVVMSSENIVSKSGFSFNPTAKEFCPNKPVQSKPTSYNIQMSTQPQAPVYFQAQQTPYMFNYGVSHDVIPLQNKNYPRLVYNVPTVYSVPAADMNNQGATQLAQSNYIHPQSNQPIFIVNSQGTYQQVPYQQVVPGPQSQYIQMAEVPSPVIRYVSHQGQQGMTHTRMPTNYQPTEAVSGNYMFSVSQPHQQHQSPVNQHSNYSAPSSSSLMQHGYVVSQLPNTNYPQIASPVTHPQVAANYRNSTPIHQVTAHQQHHQQQPFIVLAHQHMGGVPLSSNHGYIQNQHGPVFQS
ncbi:ataxin-2 isoform X2 [Hydra vulgaris]|uniref:Ataxin-2 isoform X2 n=1 Tax=Hydra vulgaris TaxID=6087 RepID=A0ABM4CP85_HYDVU